MAAKRARKLDESPDFSDVSDTEEESPSLTMDGKSSDESEQNDDQFSDAPELDESENSFEDSELYTDSDDLSDLESDGSKYVEGADGRPRLLRPEIDPHYSSDDSDREEENTIGNIPISAYDKFPHIGYDIDGKRVMRPATAGALDSLLESIDLPKGWTGLVDKRTGKALNLTKEERELINRVQSGLLPNDNINPFEDQVEWFSSKQEQMPLMATPEPKRRFVPSKHEAKQVMKLVKLIREGRLKLEAPASQNLDDDGRQMMLSSRMYDVWKNEDSTQGRSQIPAPKLAPPTHEESFNPPEEYLLDQEEKAKWLAQDPADRETNFMPAKYDALRKVPGYGHSVKERFDRMLDLYLAPRIQRIRREINPESLIPDLPSPDDLRPFPIRCSTVYEGHQGRVRCLSVDASGQFLATGGEDGTVRVYEVSTGRQLWMCYILRDDTYDNSDNAHVDDKVDAVQWHPRTSVPLLSVAAGENVYLAVPGPGLYDIDSENRAFELIEAGWAHHQLNAASTGEADDENEENEAKKSSQATAGAPAPTSKHAKWTKTGSRLSKQGVMLAVRMHKRVRKLDWHHRGDYFVTTQPDAVRGGVLIHQLSKHSTQSPFKKSKGIVQLAKFHPFKPHLYVASQRYVRVYDLSAQKLLRRLSPGARWLSSFSIHPKGDNVLTASYDRRVTWHDMELKDLPYKILRYHSRAVRDVSFHTRLPLFCSASDDGAIHVLHCSVYDDLLKNPLLVPLKILRGHKVTGGLGVLQTQWHPREPWLFSAGGDGTVCLWTT